MDLEEELVEKLGREGYCSLACRIIQKIRPDASPWVITNSKNKVEDIHFFLFDGEKVAQGFQLVAVPPKEPEDKISIWKRHVSKIQTQIDDVITPALIRQAIRSEEEQNRPKKASKASRKKRTILK